MGDVSPYSIKGIVSGQFKETVIGAATDLIDKSGAGRTINHILNKPHASASESVVASVQTAPEPAQSAIPDCVKAQVQQMMGGANPTNRAALEAAGMGEPAHGLSGSCKAPGAKGAQLS